MFKSKSIKLLNLALVLFAGFTALATSSCTEEMRSVAADRIARPAFMSERLIHAGGFEFPTWERINYRGKPATIYFEGQGELPYGQDNFTTNPNPQYPVALAMAAKDRSLNVGWIGNMCQYNGKFINRGGCSIGYVNEARFAPELIDAYNEALDNIKKTYGITSFNLVGHSSGAGVAVLVAADRDDVASIRTVAGLLDTNAWTSYHNIKPLTASINPIVAATQLENIPQHHFIGGQDDVIPPALLHRWIQNSDSNACVKYSLVLENEHSAGWAEKWPQLLERPLNCDKIKANPDQISPNLIGESPAPIIIPAPQRGDYAPNITPPAPALVTPTATVGKVEASPVSSDDFDAESVNQLYEEIK